MSPRIRQPIVASLLQPTRSATGSRAPFRPFTCSSCRAQQDQLPPQIQTDSWRSPVPQKRLPRWAATPEGMSAPFSLKKPNPRNRHNVNEDPARLDRAYVDMFGDGGDRLLTENVKWLAITHKSFDQGRRGYNDRLAYLGKRIVDLQTSLALLAQPAEVAISFERPAREVFRHPATDILPKLTRETRSQHSRQIRVAELGYSFGIHDVVRWKPRSAGDLLRSGQSFVVAQAVCAMIGALALQKGGDVAVKAVRARILPRLGLKI